MIKKSIASTALAFVFALVAVPASAAIITAHNANCGGFGTCTDAAFQAATGGAAMDVVLDFDAQSTGATFAINGGAFSSEVTFSSSISATFGGSNSVNVNIGNDGAQSEIGPVTTWDGILNIDFTKAVDAVAFGTVVLSGALERIRLYDGGGLIFNQGPVSGATFDNAGFVATGGTRITRAELEGDFFAIQNIQFRQVPEPLTLGLMGLGLAGLGFTARRKV